MAWEIKDGVQTWHMIFETTNSMTEWLSHLRSAISNIKRREMGAGKSPRTLMPAPAIERPSPPVLEISRSTSPWMTISESLRSSRPSTCSARSIDGGSSTQGNSVSDIRIDESTSSISPISSKLGELHLTTPDETATITSSERQSSEQDVAPSAFDINFEDYAIHAPFPQEVETHTKEFFRAEVETDGLHPHLHNDSERNSLISVQSHTSEQSSQKTPTGQICSPTSSPKRKTQKTLKRTTSSESSTWKKYQHLPPPYPPPNTPLPDPPMYGAQADTPE